jgi:GTP-binding protein YchF
MLADRDSLEKRVVALEKRAKGSDQEAKEFLDLVNRALPLLRDGKPARLVERKPEEERLFQQLGLMTAKPVLYVCNVDEGDADKGNAKSQAVFDRAKAEGAVAVVVSAKIESEIAVMPPADQAEFLEAVGLTEPGLNRVIRAGYDLLGLVTYFTVGPKEARAWTITKGTRAPAAAGVIHTDFEKGYVRAEIYSVEDLEQYHDEHAIKAHGRMRTEGRDYVMREGDICHFLIAK